MAEGVVDGTQRRCGSLERGMNITVVGKLEQSQQDAKFGFLSRPSNLRCCTKTRINYFTCACTACTGFPSGPEPRREDLCSPILMAAAADAAGLP